MPSTSRMSSWIWNASPISAPNSASAVRSGPPWQPGGNRAEQHARLDQRAGLLAMHALERGLAQRLLDGLEIDRLAARHAARADRIGEHAQHFETRGRADGRRRVGQHFEGARLQCIAHEYRRGFVEGAMAGWPPAAKIVVVHRRKVVVDEAVDVDELDRGRGRVEQLERRAERFAGGVHEHRTHAFAARECAVTHGLEQPRRRAALDFERAREYDLDALLIQRNAIGQEAFCRRDARAFSARCHRHRLHRRRTARSSPRHCARATLRLSVARFASAVWHWRVSATPRSNVFSASSSGTSPCSSFATRASSSASDCSKSGNFSFWVGFGFTRATLNVAVFEGQTIDDPD